MRRRRLNRGAAGVTAIAIGVVSLLLGLSPEIGSASRTQSGVVISPGAPVKPAEFRGDVRRLAKPTTIVRRNPAEPQEPEPVQKTGPTAPPIPKATTSMPATTVNFAGLDFNNWGAGHPPDTVGDVGVGYYVQAVNSSIGIWAKTGGSPLTAFTFDTLWSGAGTGTPCDTSNQGDPTVVYDQMADRYIVADFAWTDFQNGPYYECIAVSQTGNPVTGGWWLYAVRSDDAGHPWLPDYPKMGIWPDGLYMTANMFDCTSGCPYREVRAYAFNRSDLESGAVLRSRVVDLNSTAQFSLLPSNLRGGAPPAGRENLFVSESQTVFAFEVWKFHVDYSGGGSTFTGPTNVSQTAYTTAPSTVPSSGNNLDALEERLMMQNQYRNLGGTESLWVNHTVRTSSSGPTGIQWAQVNVTGGTITTTPVQQQIYGNVGADGVHRFMGSLAVDGQGDMALGYTTSKAAVNPDIRYNGRLAGDPVNTLPQGEATLQTGGGSQTGSCGGACTRWGDYSAMTVDPVDDCTFWYTNEYYATSGLNWQTRIGAFKFAGCTPGLLRVTTSPALPSQILVDGVLRDSWGLTWLKAGPGPHTVSFTHVEGWTEPAPQTVTVTAGATTTVTGTFTQRGSLRVLTSPAVPGTVSVDGVPRNDWGMWTDIATGTHSVCFGAVPGFDPPACQNSVSVTVGSLTTVTGTYTVNAAAAGPTGVGLLRVTTSPALPSQILVDGVLRDSWGLTWLKLAPGSHTVAFTHVEGWTEPAPQTVTVTADATTTVTGTFTQRGSLRVLTSPAVAGTIFVDGVPRNDWGMWTDMPTGSHFVCFGAVSGKTTPACQTAVVSAGSLTTLTGIYS